MELNEKIALLASVGILMPDGTEDEVNSAIVDYFATTDNVSYEFLLKSSTANEDILEAAIDFIKENAEKSGGENISLSSDAYTGASENGKNGKNLSTDGEEDSKLPDKKDKETSTTVNKDVTTKLAGALPKAQRSVITGLIDNNWQDIKSRANGTTISAYCVDTPVRAHLSGKTFAVTSDEYKKAFKEKFTLSNVFDDNEYGEAAEGEKPPILKEGENMKKFKEILNKIDKGEEFKVRVPDVQNQKIIGVLFNQAKGTGEEETPMLLKDVPMYVLFDCGGKIPGQPGIIVTGISSRTSTKTKNGTVSTEEKQSIAVKHKGKANAMQSDTKFIRYTSDEIEAEAAEKEFGSPTKEYSVSSVDSFIYLDKEKKKHVMRVRGKILVPYFQRKEEFAVFGPIAAANRVEALTDADKDNVALMIAAAMSSPFLQGDASAKLGLNNLLEDIEKNDTPPEFNAAVAAVG